jgi:hypothetical protein
MDGWMDGWVDADDLFVALKISNQPVLYCWKNHCEFKQKVCVLDASHIANGVFPPDPHRP